MRSQYLFPKFRILRYNAVGNVIIQALIPLFKNEYTNATAELRQHRNRRKQGSFHCFSEPVLYVQQLGPYLSSGKDHANDQFEDGKDLASLKELISL